MKKQISYRLIFGFPTGIAIGTVISILISLLTTKNQYIPCPPELIDIMNGNEILAVSLQFLLCGLIGSSFSASSVIWEKDEWSIAKQSGFYFLINSCVMMPIAYINHWMPHSVVGFVQYFLIFTVIFLLIWAIQYLIWKNKIEKINSKLK